jgi:hypothetical protein
MPAIMTSDIIDPHQREAVARQQLTDGLYQVHCQIFDDDWPSDQLFIIASGAVYVRAEHGNWRALSPGHLVSKLLSSPVNNIFANPDLA